MVFVVGMDLIRSRATFFEWGLERSKVERRVWLCRERYSCGRLARCGKLKRTGNYPVGESKKGNMIFHHYPRRPSGSQRAIWGYRSHRSVGSTVQILLWWRLRTKTDFRLLFYFFTKKQPGSISSTSSKQRTRLSCQKRHVFYVPYVNRREKHSPPRKLSW